MNPRIIYLIFFLFIISCTNNNVEINYSKNFKNYSNKGFTLIYDTKLLKKNIIDKKLDDRSLLIFNNSLKQDTPVRVTNLLNGKYLVAKVSKNADYPFFYNSVISKRIASDLEINSNEPYIEIKTLNRKNSFIIGKAKTFDEEKKVAGKVPVQVIKIENISNKNIKSKEIKSKYKLNNKFKYIIKIADLYFMDSAIILKDRLVNEHGISEVNIKKMSKNSYRVYIGPFYSLDSIKSEYSDIIKLNFENVEIIKI